MAQFPPNFPRDKVPTRILFGSCSDSHESLDYWHTICDLQPDIVLLMGDNVYGRRSTLRQEYETLQHSPGFVRAKQELCILATVDDNDYDRRTAASRAESKQLFQNLFQPIFACSGENDENEGFYQVYQWGNDLQIILLDLRSFMSRTGTSCNVSSGNSTTTTTTTTTSTTILGEKQWEWLEQQLQIDASLRLLVSPLQVISQAHAFECWNMMPTEREKLLKMIRDKNVLLLSGDRHVSAMYCHDGQFEITSSSLTHSAPFGLLDNEDDPHRISDFVHDNNFGMMEILHTDDEKANDEVLSITIRSCKKDNEGKVLKEWCLTSRTKRLLLT